ncbi:ZIP zinc transporter-domain-containing protein [Peziza echinospora]|nr:ZIP zinc transporter-domain-containing protein [Peziza echinospora]
MSFTNMLGNSWPTADTTVPDDKRGWLLASASGAACVLGSCIICLDLLTRCVPAWRGFNIRKNKTFLSASLSLSFGVMIFSALYGILPEATSYLIEGGKAPQTAKFMSIAFFMVGVVGLSIVSEFLHHFLPSSIVHCEHSDGTEHLHHPSHTDGEESEGEDTDDDEDTHGHHHSHESEHGPHDTHRPNSDQTSTDSETVVAANEDTPLLGRNPSSRRSSFKSRLSHSVTSLVVGKKGACVGDGTCYGYSESRPCDRMCQPHIKSVRKARSLPCSENGHATGEVHSNGAGYIRGGVLENGHAGAHHQDSSVRPRPTASVHSHDHSGHHHVPKNEFLSIGLQTSLAIALHKIPEGFITFATNHANPKLGFAVFLALFIHNLTEGFAISLPLFLAFKSRPKAILWASILGGLSQPAGALFASIWLDSNKGAPPSEVVYGILFAITAGIMSNVGLQLYGQAVSIYHNQKLPLIFAFLGMSILGISFAMAEI